MTLIELLVVLAIAAILVAAGSPAYTWTIVNSRLDSFVNQFEDAVRLTRMHSIRTGNIVQMQPDPNPSDWSGGIKVMSDYGGGQSNTHRIFPPLRPGIQTVNAPNIFYFDRQGYGANPSSPTGWARYSTTFSACLSGSGRRITVTASGQVRVISFKGGVCS